MELVHKINKPIVEVYNYLIDMQKFASVHPVITKIEKRSDSDYLVYETLKLGFISYSFKYPAMVITSTPDNLITMRAVVWGAGTVEMRFLLNTRERFTIVEEEVTTNSVWPITALIYGLFKKQHKQLFKNIEQQ